MEALEFAFRFAPLLMSAVSVGITVMIYRAGVRKGELTALGAQIAKVDIRVDKLAEELGDHKEDGQNSRTEMASRLGQVELTLTQMPDKEMVHKLALDVSEMRGDVRVQGENLKAIGATTHRVETFLLDAAKGGHK